MLHRAHPELSIITPVFNGRDFIEGCIRNVVEQGVGATEHLIIDGGSRDGTAEIALRLAQEHPHVRVVHEPDRGQSDALNKGVRMARAPVLGILNVDDYYEPGTLADVRERFRTLTPPVLVAGNCNVWDAAGKLSFVSVPHAMSFRALLRKPELENFPINPAAYFYHRELHDRAGEYDVAEDLGMDLDFLLRAFRVARLVHVDRVYGNFRLHDRTKTHAALASGATARRVTQILRRRRAALPWYLRWTFPRPR